MKQYPTRAEKTVNEALEYLGSIEVTHILSTTALEVISYSQSIKDEISEVMRRQIEWAEPGSRHRIQPDEIDGVMAGAQHEVADGFQRLNSQTLVGLWSGLEVFVEDLFVAWIDDHPDSLNEEAFLKLKIPLAEFMRLEDEGRRRSLYQLYIASQPGTRALGATRFESALQPLGLLGQIDSEVSEALYELHIVRNLLVHQGGRVDARFRQSDFGSKYQIGEKIYLHEGQFQHYKAAVFAYATLLGDRVKARQNTGGGNRAE